MAYNSETDKIDKLATDGLSGVSDSLAYRTGEIERHCHNVEKWFGSAASASGETHVADRCDGTIGAFTLTSGNSDFGSWVQILGSSDTPCASGAAYFDSDRYIITGTSSTNLYVLQVISGESADFATKLAAEQFTTTTYISSSNLNDSGVATLKTRRTAAGTKVWARCACVGANAQTITIYFGIHEYEG